jgi:hypothetical protein
MIRFSSFLLFTDIELPYPEFTYKSLLHFPDDPFAGFLDPDRSNRQQDSPTVKDKFPSSFSQLIFHFPGRGKAVRTLSVPTE